MNSRLAVFGGILALAFVSCSPISSATHIKGKTAQPLLKTWALSIPTSGHVISVSGKAEALTSGINKYLPVAVGSPILPGHILRLTRSSNVTIGFENRPPLVVSPADYPDQGQGDEVYFTIELQEPANQALLPTDHACISALGG